MVSDLRASIEFLQELGFLNVLLPFIFVYVVLFAILEKTKALGVEKNGKAKTNINSMVAFVVGFIFIASASRVETLTTYLQILGMGMVFIMTILYMFAAWGQKQYFDKKTYLYGAVLVFVVVGFFYSMGLANSVKWGFIFELIFNPIVIIVLTFYIVVMYITHGDKKKKGTTDDPEKIKNATEEIKEYSSEKMEH